MRNLTVSEIDCVSGAGALDKLERNITAGGSIGSAIGFILTSTVHGAVRAGLVGGAGMFAFTVGHMAGTAIYNRYLR